LFRAQTVQAHPFIIKICGVTNKADAGAALAAGADWIGLNFVGGPRRIEPDTALEIIASLTDPAAAVALVSVDAPSHGDLINRLAASGLRRLQLYGRVTPVNLDALAARGLESILVCPVGTQAQFAEFGTLLKTCRAAPAFVLLDAHVPGRQGGTGQPADWKLIQSVRRAGLFAGWPPLLLAGGLNPQNVATSISHVSPVGVDVSSGVESTPGIKDAEKLRAFVRAARSVVSSF
jgi:phosphoribosylanthranilate isomerase